MIGSRSAIWVLEQERDCRLFKFLIGSRSAIWVLEQESDSRPFNFSIPSREDISLMIGMMGL